MLNSSLMTLFQHGVLLSVVLGPAVDHRVFTARQAESTQPKKAQPGSIVGRWRVEYTLESQTRVLQFDALASGKGAFLSLDPHSSLAPPTPIEASWSQPVKGGVRFSGAIEFPIGNVGRQRGHLDFNGTFSSSDVLTGDVTYTSSLVEPKDAVPVKGTFKATRMTEAERPRKHERRSAS